MLYQYTLYIVHAEVLKRIMCCDVRSTRLSSTWSWTTSSTRSFSALHLPRTAQQKAKVGDKATYSKRGSWKGSGF